jgi:hypothetical protein
MAANQFAAFVETGDGGGDTAIWQNPDRTQVALAQGSPPRRPELAGLLECGDLAVAQQWTFVQDSRLKELAQSYDVGLH